MGCYAPNINHGSITITTVMYLFTIGRRPYQDGNGFTFPSYLVSNVSEISPFCLIHIVLDQCPSQFGVFCINANSTAHVKVAFTSLLPCLSFLKHNTFVTFIVPTVGIMRTQTLWYPLLRTQADKCSPFKAWNRSEYSHTCFAHFQECLPCPNVYLPGLFSVTFPLRLRTF